jgi:hypothetical protein
MPTPTSIDDLSTVAGSNYPAGTDSPIVLDDVQRAHASFIAELRDKSRETFSVTDKGADPTGAVDATAAFNLAAAQAIADELTLVGQGTFKISGAVNLRNVRCDFSSATIILDSGASSFVIGGSSFVKTNPKQSFKKITRSGGVTSTPTVRIAGSKDQAIEIDNVDYLQVYADATTAPTTDGSFAYSSIRLGNVDKLELSGADSSSWINENNFYLQRCAELIVSGAYGHNHNHFHGGVFESGANITFNTGKDNYIHNARFESGGTVTFASGTERNTVINTWDSSRVPFDDPGVTVVDSGFDNAVMDDFSLYRYSDTVAYTDISAWVPDTQTSPSTPRYSHLQRIATASATVDIIQSGFVAINAGDVFRWVTVSNTGDIDNASCKYRAKIYFYDAKLMPITASTDFIYAPIGSMSTLSGNSIRSGADTAKSAVWIQPAAITAGVRFVKVSWLSTGGTSAVQMFVTHFTQHQNVYKGIAGQVIQPKEILVSGSPTQGYAEAGATCIKSDGSAKYLNKIALESTLSIAAVTSDASVTISALAGTAIGDIVGINLDNGDTHWTTVSARTSTLITLTVAMPSAAAIGSRIVFNRWAAY